MAGHRIEHLLHFGFIYKAKANPSGLRSRGERGNEMVIRRQLEHSFHPPVPTALTTRMRTSLLWHPFRFLVINVEILRMVRKH